MFNDSIDIENIFKFGFIVGSTLSIFGFVVGYGIDMLLSTFKHIAKK